MTVSVLVPWRSDGDTRARAWAWLARWWHTCFPSWELVEGHDTGEQWCKGEAVDDALSRATGDVLVIADADVLIEPALLEQAVAELDAEYWVVPYRRVLRSARYPTDELLATKPSRASTLPWDLDHPPQPYCAGGGIAVLRRASYERVGGIDRRFTGWGGEDRAFGQALDTLVGTHVALDADLWHLHHPMRHRAQQRSAESEALSLAYAEAYYSGRDAMRAVLEGARC